MLFTKYGILEDVELSKSGLRALSGFCADIAQVWFAAFVASLVLPLDTAKVLVLVLYLGSSTIFWLLSVLFAEKGKL